MHDRQDATTARPPGALTAVMRAEARRAAPRALRVGLVHRGKVIDERVVAAGEHLTIGPSEHATFVVTEPGIPPGFRLFDSTPEGFRLQVTPRMSGRVAGAEGVVDIPALGEGAARAVPLAGDARGKVVVGDHIVLFQLVPIAPPLGKPQLPASVKSGLGEVDWRTSIVAAFSFLFHFGAVGSVYSDWMDPVVDDEVQAAQLLESLRELPPPPPVERPKDEAPSPSASAAASAAPRPAGPSGGRVATTGAPGGGGAARGDARAHQLSSQMAALDMQMIASINGAGPATSSVLGPGSDLPLGMLEKSAASSSGVREGGTAGLDLGGNPGAPLRPGSITRTAIPGDTTMSPVTAGTGVVVRPPSGSVAVPPPVQIGGEIPGAGGVVAGMTAGFRRCYNLGLGREDPTMKGSVRITAKIGPNGEVLSASASGSGNLSPTVIGCMRSRVASAQFSPPPGGGATLVIPITVIPQ